MKKVPASVLLHYNEEFRAQSTNELLKTVLNDDLFGNIALVSSFGTQSAVLLHLIAQIDPSIPVLFIDTGKLFADTHFYRVELTRRLGLNNVNIVRPDPVHLQNLDSDGQLWNKENNACCALRKVNPLRKELAHYDSWISGRKQFQGGLRQNLNLFEQSGQHIKINPLAFWKRRQIDQYMEDHDMPYHPLSLKNFGSVGCEPCTMPVNDPENDRTGRWQGQSKTECGIHLPGV